MSVEETQARTAGSFPNPFEIETPPGAEGWERMYPPYMLFSEDRRDLEERQFWFHDSMHYPDPMYPFDMVMPEQTAVLLNSNTTRYHVVPTALGIDHRVVNGYVYISPNVVRDPEEIKRRAEHFGVRAGHYFENWPALYDKWVEKARAVREELESLQFRPLPAEEPLERVQAGEERNTAYGLLSTYNRLLENINKIGHLHFEMLGLGYGAYVTFGDFCKSAFPDVKDQTIAGMVAGIDILMFRPDDELKALARLAVELDVAEPLEAGGDAERVLAAIRALPRGEEWIAALERAREPWFWFATGAGMTHVDPAWNDDLAIPFGLIGTYTAKLRAGEAIERPLESVEAERDRITAEYRELLAEEDRATFDELLALARMIYPFVENHNFYCEHQHHSRLWNKVRELGEVFAERGFFDDAEDVFMIHRFEMYEAIWDMLTGWATETPDRRAYWKRTISERKAQMEALRQWSPPPALGPAPDALTEPFTVMLWGVTDDTLERWRSAADGGGSGNELHGVAASSGVAEGPARVIFSPSELDQVQPGEVLVCPITAPSWAPVFTKIAGAVSDIGGIMAHAAIVSREYGLPAVVGTGFGTKSIRTGQRIRVDGSRGLVTLLD